jgi:hypothetical protein
MLAIIAAISWIVLDVVMTLITSPAIPLWQWRGIVYGGTAVVLFTIAAGVYEHFRTMNEERNRTQEMSDLKDRLLKQEGILTGMGFSLGQTHNLLVKERETKPEATDALQSAISQIGQLESKLQSMQWRTITAEQRKRFGEAIPKEPKIAIWKIFCVPADAEAESYVKQLVRMFVEAGIYTSEGGYYNINTHFPQFDKYGCAILVKDANSIIARILKHAFEFANIDFNLTSEGFASSASDGFLAIRIGPKPE